MRGKSRASQGPTPKIWQWLLEGFSSPPLGVCKMCSIYNPTYSWCQHPIPLLRSLTVENRVLKFGGLHGPALQEAPHPPRLRCHRNLSHFLSAGPSHARPCMHVLGPRKLRMHFRTQPEARSLKTEVSCALASERGSLATSTHVHHEMNSGMRK